MSRKKILVPVDIRHDSAGLLRFAGNIAIQNQGRISCVHVMQDYNLPESSADKLRMRRFVELELARATTGTFTHIQPEFDIIVTQGDFTTRIAKMIDELQINLLVAHLDDLATMKTLQAILPTPILIFSGHETKIHNLILMLNLDDKYYQKLQCSIDVAHLLNARIQVEAFTASAMSEFRFKEKLDDIRFCILKEDIPCKVHFTKLQNVHQRLPVPTNKLDSSLILSIDELKEYPLTMENINYSITLLPANKKQQLNTPIRKEHFLN